MSGRKKTTITDVMSWFGIAPSRKAALPDAEMSLRRWDSAATDRLNQSQWAKAKGSDINADLASGLESLRSRCIFESANNGFVEGVISTWCTDVVGAEGPILQVLSQDVAYVKAFESAWEEWWAMPDVRNMASGVDLLHLWERQRWTHGEVLVMFTTGDDGAIRLRLDNIDPQRLGKPDKADENIVLGVRITPYGKPISYLIRDHDESKPLQFLHNWREIKASEIIHSFRQIEPGQLRGIPWLAPVLQSIRDLRDYDTQVLDAARAAADWCVLLHANGADVDTMEIGPESTEIERRTMRTLPPGWMATQMVPQQPSTKYVEFRQERLRELGRPINMPLMMVKLDSSGHNYSSARFDGQVYGSSIETEHGHIKRTLLNPILRQFRREAELAGVVPPPPPDAQFTWGWAPRPHVDPVKEATADAIQLANNTITLQHLCASKGLDWEDVLLQRQREKQKLAELGLTEGETDEPTDAGDDATDTDDDAGGKPDSANDE